MMRDNHLTAEEIIKYMDTSDLSEGYLLWMEEISEHFLSCSTCQTRLRKALIVESICEEDGLAAGIRMMVKMEKAKKTEKKPKESIFRRRKDVVWKEKDLEFIPEAYESMASASYECAQSIFTPPDKIVHYMFSKSALIQKASTVRGAEAESTTTAMNGHARQPIAAEIICGRKLIVRFSKEAVQEQIGNAGPVVRVAVRTQGYDAIVKEAVLNETDGQYVAEFDIYEIHRNQIEIYLEK